MSKNTFGHLFSVTTFGESHGPAIGCVIDGCPPGLLLSESDIQPDLDRRKPGQSRFVTQRKEADCVQILSGTFEGKTTGTPITLLIQNTDQRSQDYGDIARSFRPSHADIAYWHKYGIRDYRGGGRASARETAARVAAGAVARKWLFEQYGVTIRAYLAQMGDIVIGFDAWEAVNQNPFFAPNLTVVPLLEEKLDALRKQLDSCGAKIHVQTDNVPIGWGEPVFDKLDAMIAHAMMSINAVKGVEIGDGFNAVAMLGSAFNDPITSTGFLSNHAGGILGGISSGQAICVNIAIKPTPSIATPMQSIDTNHQPIEVITKGRHDPCVGIRAVPVTEAMMALVLIDAALMHRAQNKDERLPFPITET